MTEKCRISLKGSRELVDIFKPNYFHSMAKHCMVWVRGGRKVN